MTLWFLTLAILGVNQIVQLPVVFKAFNPYYALQLIVEHPSAMLVVGCSISLYNRGRSALLRFGALWVEKHSNYLDIRKVGFNS